MKQNLLNTERRRFNNKSEIFANASNITIGGQKGGAHEQSRAYMNDYTNTGTKPIIKGNYLLGNLHGSDSAVVLGTQESMDSLSGLPNMPQHARINSGKYHSLHRLSQS